MKPLLPTIFLLCTVVLLHAQVYPSFNMHRPARPGLPAGSLYQHSQLDWSIGAHGNIVQQIDSANRYTWEAALQQYRFSSHSLYRHSPNELVIERYNMNRILTKRDSTIYDEHGRELEDFSSLWAGNSWLDVRRFISAYDPDGNAIELVLQQSQGDGLKNFSRDTNTFNAAGLLTEHLKQDWNFVNQTWENNLRETSTYNTDDLISEVLTERWDVDVYKNKYKTTYSYGAHDKLDLVQYESWMNDQWVVTDRILYTYNAGFQLIEQETQSLDSGIWNPT